MYSKKNILRQTTKRKKNRKSSTRKKNILKKSNKCCGKGYDDDDDDDKIPTLTLTRQGHRMKITQEEALIIIGHRVKEAQKKQKDMTEKNWNTLNNENVKLLKTLDIDIYEYNKVFDMNKSLSFF